MCETHTEHSLPSSCDNQKTMGMEAELLGEGDLISCLPLPNAEKTWTAPRMKVSLLFPESEQTVESGSNQQNEGLLL